MRHSQECSQIRGPQIQLAFRTPEIEHTFFFELALARICEYVAAVLSPRRLRFDGDDRAVGIRVPQENFTRCGIAPWSPRHRTPAFFAELANRLHRVFSRHN